MMGVGGQGMGSTACVRWHHHRSLGHDGSQVLRPRRSRGEDQGWCRHDRLRPKPTPAEVLPLRVAARVCSVGESATWLWTLVLSTPTVASTSMRVASSEQATGGPGQHRRRFCLCEWRRGRAVGAKSAAAGPAEVSATAGPRRPEPRLAEVLPLRVAARARARVFRPAAGVADVRFRGSASVPSQHRRRSCHRRGAARGRVGHQVGIRWGPCGPGGGSASAGGCTL